MTKPARDQQREMKRRWHAWKAANPDKQSQAMEMIEKGYTLSAIMETLGGSVAAAASSSSSPQPPSSQDDAKAMWKRQTDKINARNARFWS